MGLIPFKFKNDVKGGGIQGPTQELVIMSNFRDLVVLFSF